MDIIKKPGMLWLALKKKKICYNDFTFNKF